MHRLKLVRRKSTFGTSVYLDDVEVHGVAAIECSKSVDAPDMVKLTLYVESIEAIDESIRLNTRASKKKIRGRK